MSAVQAMALDGAKAKNENRTRILYGFSLVAILFTLITLGLALGYAPQEATQGDVQRIFYIHMASFFGAFVAFGAAVIGGIQYLRTREVRWDTFALAGVEVGLLLAFINLATGSIWARPIWNTWWTWDPRLTSAAIMFLTYVAYLMLRNGIDNIERRRVFAAVYGILAILTVILTLVIIRIRPDTIHPTVIGSSPSEQAQEDSFRMPAAAQQTLILTLITWSLLITPALMWWRIRLENQAQRIEQMKHHYMES